MASSLTATNRVHAILATDDHADAIATFYREAWGEPATPEGVLAARRTAAAENVAVPGEAPPIALVLEGSRVIGHLRSAPYRPWDGIAQHPAPLTQRLV